MSAPRPAALVLTALVFAVLFGYLLFQGVANLVALPDYYAAIGIGDAVPWPLLIAGVAVPAAAYVAALLLGRGRPLFARVLLLAAGLAASSALALATVALAGALQPPLV